MRKLSGSAPLDVFGAEMKKRRIIEIVEISNVFLPLFKWFQFYHLSKDCAIRKREFKIYENRTSKLRYSFATSFMLLFSDGAEEERTEKNSLETKFEKSKSWTFDLLNWLQKKNRTELSIC